MLLHFACTKQRSSVRNTLFLHNYYIHSYTNVKVKIKHWHMCTLSQKVLQMQSQHRGNVHKQMYAPTQMLCTYTYSHACLVYSHMCSLHTPASISTFSKLRTHCSPRQVTMVIVRQMMDSTVPIYDTQVRAASLGPGGGGAGLMSCRNGRKKGHTAECLHTSGYCRKMNTCFWEQLALLWPCMVMS